MKLTDEQRALHATLMEMRDENYIVTITGTLPEGSKRLCGAGLMTLIKNGADTKRSKKMYYITDIPEDKMPANDDPGYDPEPNGGTWIPAVHMLHVALDPKLTMAPGRYTPNRRARPAPDNDVTTSLSPEADDMGRPYKILWRPTCIAF